MDNEVNLEGEVFWEIATHKSKVDSIIETRASKRNIIKLQDEVRNNKSHIETLKESLEYSRNIIKRYKEGITEKIIQIHDLKASVRELSEEIEMKNTYIKNSKRAISIVPKIITYDETSGDCTLVSRGLRIKGQITFNREKIEDKCYLCLCFRNRAVEFKCKHFVCGECYLSNWDTSTFDKCGVCRYEVE